MKKIIPKKCFNDIKKHPWRESYVETMQRRDVWEKEVSLLILNKFLYIFQGTEHLQKKIVNYELPADYKGFINVILGKIQLELNIHSL